MGEVRKLPLPEGERAGHGAPPAARALLLVAVLVGAGVVYFFCGQLFGMVETLNRLSAQVTSLTRQLDEERRERVELERRLFVRPK